MTASCMQFVTHRGGDGAGSNSVNVSHAELNEELAIFRRWVAATPQNAPTEIMKELAYGPQAILFPTLTKLATSYLLLPLGTATVEPHASALAPAEAVSSQLRHWQKRGC